MDASLSLSLATLKWGGMIFTSLGSPYSGVLMARGRGAGGPLERHQGGDHRSSNEEERKEEIHLGQVGMGVPWRCLGAQAGFPEVKPVYSLHLMEFEGQARPSGEDTNTGKVWERCDPE
jgi:hypothetical protein